MIDKDKLKEILKELARPKKFEVGFVDARRIVTDGLSIIGLDSSDILGFAKEANETRTRRVKGAQAWYKRMYRDGWRFKGAFEYEGLMYNGFIIMERELPNKRLEELIESLSDEEKKILPTTLSIDRGPELPPPFQIKMNEGKTPKIEEAVQTTKKALKSMGYKEDEITITKAREPKEGFESGIADFIVDAQGGMKNLEEIFFDETGKNAIWKGKETKGFKNWKEERDE